LVSIDTKNPKNTSVSLSFTHEGDIKDIICSKLSEKTTTTTTTTRRTTSSVSLTKWSSGETQSSRSDSITTTEPQIDGDPLHSGGQHLIVDPFFISSLFLFYSQKFCSIPILFHGIEVNTS